MIFSLQILTQKLLLWHLQVHGETKSTHNGEFSFREGSKTRVSEGIEKSFCSQDSDLGIDMARECSAISAETYTIEECQQVDGATKFLAQPSDVNLH